MTNLLRTLTPLPLRKLLGPWIGYGVYLWRTRVRGRTWEPEVLPPLQTLHLIEKTGCSFIRFGDGELSLISGSDLGFQRYDRDLAAQLRTVLTSTNATLLICVPGIFGRLEPFTKKGFWFEIHHLFRHAPLWRTLIDPSRTYGDAFITRPYLSYRDPVDATDVFGAFRRLWQDRDIVIVEGAGTRSGVGNDLFANARSRMRILGPAEHAYEQADAIIEKVSELPTDRLILLALGPAAKVIGHALHERGYRVLDIGHLDMEYEMFLRQSPHLVTLPDKYFNEADARDPQPCTDPTYRAEIIASYL